MTGTYQDANPLTKQRWAVSRDMGSRCQDCVIGCHFGHEVEVVNRRTMSEPELHYQQCSLASYSFKDTRERLPQPLQQQAS